MRNVLNKKHSQNSLSALILKLVLLSSGLIFTPVAMSDFDFNPRLGIYDETNALALGRAASLAYKQEKQVFSTLESWGFPRSKIHFFDIDGTQAYIAVNKRMILIAFRGTQTTQLVDLKTDAKIKLTPDLKGQVHRGFKNGLDKVWQQMLTTVNDLQTQAQPIWVTGHSLGEALANLAVARLVLAEQPISVQGLYTFGSPRIGDTEFASAFDAVFQARYFRIRNNNDVVTRVPVPGIFWLKYRHVGTLHYFDRSGQLSSDMSSAWDQSLDRIKGRLDDIGNPGTDGMKDHSMDLYLKLLKRNKSTP